MVNLIFDVFDLAAFLGSQSDQDHINYPQPVDEQSFFCDAFIKIIFGMYVHARRTSWFSQQFDELIN